MPMFWLALAGAAVAAGSSIAANAQTGNSARIRALQQAEQNGGLTKDNQAAADAGYTQAERGMTDVQNKSADQMAKMGGTSGADIASLNAGGQKATADLYEKAGDTFRQAQAAQREELVGRQEVKRTRTMDTITGTAKGAIGGASAGAAKAGYNGKPMLGKAPSEAPAWDQFPGSAENLAKMQEAYEADMDKARKALFPAPEIEKVNQKWQAVLAHPSDIPLPNGVPGANDTTGAQP